MRFHVFHRPPPSSTYHSASNSQLSAAGRPRMLGLLLTAFGSPRRCVVSISYSYSIRVCVIFLSWCMVCWHNELVFKYKIRYHMRVKCKSVRFLWRVWDYRTICVKLYIHEIVFEVGIFGLNVWSQQKTREKHPHIPMAN